MLEAYLKESLTIAARSSWRAANGLFGAAIAGAALIWPGVQQFILRADWWTDAANWLCSFATYAVVAWIILFILQLIFVAPFQLWRNERSKNATVKADSQLNDTRRQGMIEHDRKLSARIREIFPEPQKQKLTSDLLNAHLYWDSQSNCLGEAINFLDSAETHFLDEVLRQRAKQFADAGAELLKFMAYKFFVYPKERLDRPLMFAMQPSLNIDREGDGSVEQQDKYDALTDELDANVNRMSAAYDELIRAFHKQLLA
jgi:hypothetical protein